MAQTNVAYDFERLEQHYAPAAPRVKQPPELRVVEGRGQGASLARAAAVFILVLAIVCAILYNKVALTELTTQVEQAQTQLESLKSEQRRLEVELESKTSLRTVQEIAEDKLGMAKAESYQIQYVDLGAGDRVLLAKDHQPRLTDKIREVYHSVLEYLGI